jgi:hypothetical protein
MSRDPDDDDGYDFPPSELATLVLSIVSVIALIYYLL